MENLDRARKMREYAFKPEEAKKDIDEFGETISVIATLLSDPDEFSKICTTDLLNLLVDFKEFNDKIKPFCIKYGIVNLFR